MVYRFHNLLMAPAKYIAASRTLIWLALSLAIALAYSLPALQEALNTPFLIQDDARQHVFWMQRFVDPELFPNDLIADYFQAVAPAGYSWLYRLAAWVGLDPILFHKLLPVALNLITAGYCFSVCFQLLPVPLAAFVASVLLGQGLGLTDAIVSATPKAFVYPLLLAFMDAVLRRKLWLALVAIALQGLFYPQLVLLSSGVLILRLVQWRDGIPLITRDRGDRRLVFAGLAMAFLILLPYALQSHAFGPTITAADARQLPEFSIPGSRTRFFSDDDPATFWLKGRSGLRFATALTPVTNAFGIVLPVMMVLSGLFPLVRQLKPGLALLLQLLVSSLVWFGVAHETLFRLHLPSRYTQHSIRVVLTLSAAIAIVVILDTVWRWAIARIRKPSSIRNSIAIVLTGLFSVVVLGYPWFVAQFPITAYQTGRVPELYEFLRSQPTDSLIASLSDEANNLPSFAQRSVLVAEEYAIPYHTGYYTEFRQRLADATRAQYSPDIESIRSVIQQYGISHWLLDRPAFEPTYIENRLWVRQYPDILASVLELLNESRGAPALESRVSPCTVFRQQGLILLDAQCIVQDGAS